MAAAIKVGEEEETPAWVPFREVLYRWHRDEEGRLAYHLCMNKPVIGFDPDECGHPQTWWDWDEG